MIKKHKHLLMSITAITFLFILASCGTSNDPDAQKTNNTASNSQSNNNEEASSDTETNDGAENNENENKANDANEDNAAQSEDQDYSSETNPIVTLTMENDDEIEIELYPDVAPNTVANFISLVEESYYDGLIFHRVMPSFMIQGGDPEGNGTGGPGYGIPGEFETNGFENDLVHERGVISMARSQDPDSAGSQFFIVVEDSPHLDGEYAGFGQVISGIKITDDIVSVDTDQADKPEKNQVIKTMTVDTKGVDYEKPEMIE